MLNPRLETFYEKVVCEDFVVLYNFTNITLLPKFEEAVLSSTSNKFGNEKISVLQSFSAWRICTSQKSITTRARKSIALFNIRKDILLGLKVTLRKKTLFSFLDKALIFVLPISITNKNISKEKKSLLSGSFLDFPITISCVQNVSKPVLLSLPAFLKNKLFSYSAIDDNCPLQKVKSVVFLDKLRNNWDKQENVNFSIAFSSSDNNLEKNQDNDFNIREKKKKIFSFLKKFTVKTNNKTTNFFTISSSSPLSFPETSSLSSFFYSLSGFSLTFSLKKSKLLPIFCATREEKIKKQLLSAYGCPKS